MTETFNPVTIEHAIKHCADRIAKGVRVCSEYYAAKLAAERDYDKAFARAYLHYEGAAHERKYAAELATVELREAKDAADVAYRYAASTARALEDELRALQSVNKAVVSAYSVAGVGER